MNKFPCKDCGGSGGVAEKRHGILAMYKCPTCKGGGGKRLCVPCDCPSWGEEFEEHAKTCTGKRPLTDEELEELLNKYKWSMEYTTDEFISILQAHTDHFKPTFNNQPVTLEPMEG